MSMEKICGNFSKSCNRNKSTKKTKPSIDFCLYITSIFIDYENITHSEDCAEHTKVLYIQYYVVDTNNMLI